MAACELEATVNIHRTTTILADTHNVDSILNPERETVARRSALVGRDGEAEMRTETSQAARKWEK